jgi:tetratricopeptide (TPR) repeat protein
MVQIRQGAYTVSVHARRRVLHRRAFEVLKEWGASPPAKPAFGYSMAAGDAAMEVFAAQDAIEHYKRARSLLAEEGRTGGGRPVEPSIPELEHLYTQLGRAYEGADEWGKAKAAYETMLALGQQLGEARLEVLSLNHLAILSFSKQEPDLPKAKSLLEEARRVAEEAGLEERLVETECNLVDLMTIWTGRIRARRSSRPKGFDLGSGPRRAPGSDCTGAVDPYQACFSANPRIPIKKRSCTTLLPGKER